MTDDLVKRLRDLWQDEDVQEAGVDLIMAEAADRIEELEKALREKNNISFIIDSHGITHRSFTVVYFGEKIND